MFLENTCVFDEVAQCTVPEVIYFDLPQIYIWIIVILIFIHAFYDSSCPVYQCSSVSMELFVFLNNSGADYFGKLWALLRGLMPKLFLFRVHFLWWTSARFYNFVGLLVHSTGPIHDGAHPVLCSNKRKVSRYSWNLIKWLNNFY